MLVSSYMLLNYMSFYHTFGMVVALQES